MGLPGQRVNVFEILTITKYPSLGIVLFYISITTM